jgi:hypothetical protein
MTIALEGRHNATRITSLYGDPNDTYRQFLAGVNTP